MIILDFIKKKKDWDDIWVIWVCQNNRLVKVFVGSTVGTQNKNKAFTPLPVLTFKWQDMDILNDIITYKHYILLHTLITQRHIKYKPNRTFQCPSGQSVRLEQDKYVVQTSDRLYLGLKMISKIRLVSKLRQWTIRWYASYWQLFIQMMCFLLKAFHFNKVKGCKLH